jgi:hypothetical protein
MSLFSSLFNVEDRSCFQGGTEFLNNITSNHMVFVLYITIQNNTSTIMAKSNLKRARDPIAMSTVKTKPKESTSDVKNLSRGNNMCLIYFKLGYIQSK